MIVRRFVISAYLAYELAAVALVVIGADQFAGISPVILLGFLAVGILAVWLTWLFARWLWRRAIDRKPTYVYRMPPRFPRS